jgi:hypothetical protein
VGDGALASSRKARLSGGEGEVEPETVLLAEDV